jgi:hypothetical protein
VDIIPATQRRTVAPLLRDAAQKDVRQNLDTRSEQNAIRNIAVVGDTAMTAAAILKRQQRELELLAPEASGVLDLIATTAAIGIANRVARFAEGV